MNPSVNSTPKQEDLSQNWDQYPAGAAFCYGPRYNQTSHTDWEWENPMLLMQNSARCTGDQEMAECKPNMMVDTIGSSLHQFNDIFPGAFPSTLTQNAWGMLNFTGIRDVGDSVEASPQIYHDLSTPFHNSGFEALGNCTFPAGNISSGDHRLIEQKQFLGNLNQDARGMHDFLRREIYSSLDLSGRVGLNLGGRTYFSSEEDYSTFTRFGKRLRPYSPAAQAAPMCQAEGCKADLHIAKHYHRRHKVCEFHSKASSVIIGGQTQRFCQQCSRFHALSEFDDGKRSCRKRLADHNRRRRKPQSHSPSSTNANSAAHKRTTLSATESRDPNKYHASPEHKREDITMSLVTSVSDVIEEEKPLVCGGSAKRSTYDHYLRKNGCTGPGLSLSSLGGSDTSLTTQRQSSGQGQDLSVSWLGPMGAKASPDEVVDRSAFQNLEKARGSSTLQALPHVTQNLLQIQSRPQDHAIPHTGWMMDIGCHEHEHEQLHELDLHQSAQRKSQSQNMLSLFEVREWNDPRTQNRQHGAVPLEFVMEHQPLTSTNLNDVPHCHSMMADEQGLALEELGGLRSFNQSLYH